MSNLAHVVHQLRKEWDQAQCRVEHLDAAFEGAERGRRATRNCHKTRPCSGVESETKADVSCGPQTNCSRPARAVGKVEGSAAEEIGRRLCANAIGSRQRRTGKARGYFGARHASLPRF
jgi:hypothetical protein